MACRPWTSPTIKKSSPYVQPTLSHSFHFIFRPIRKTRNEPRSCSYVCYFDFRSSKTTSTACRTSLRPSSRVPSTRLPPTEAAKVQPTWSTLRALRLVPGAMAPPPRCLTRYRNLSAKIAMHSCPSGSQVDLAPQVRLHQRSRPQPLQLFSTSRTKRGSPSNSSKLSMKRRTNLPMLIV